jgi:hypothetical protein
MAARVPAARQLRVPPYDAAMEPPDRFVLLAEVGDLLAARVSAAVLGDAGIESRLRGESLGPYPMTVGRMAVTEIWVMESDMAEARLVMLESEIEHTLGADVRSGAVADPNSLPMQVIAAGAGVILVFAVVWELMRVF